MYYHEINPTIASIGPFEIRYYGLIYVIGFLIAYFLISYLARQRKLGISEEKLSDFFLYVLVGLVAGARIFYVIFYNPPYFIQNPLEIFAVWQGGLSFHGGFFGIVIAGLIFCRKNKINFYKMADICVIPAAIGLMLGRMMNFVNGELYGRLTDAWWAVKFPNADGFRHPSQLYESFKNFAIFSILWFSKDKKLPDGTIFWLFIALYGTFRFVIEFARAPDPQLGFIISGITMGQLLNMPMILLGFAMIWKLNR